MIVLHYDKASLCTSKINLAETIDQDVLIDLNTPEDFTESTLVKYSTHGYVFN
jgi:hypothetical protein